MTAAPCACAHNETVRLRMRIQGAVQGVGFRPFVFRLATELGLLGWVNNSTRGVEIEVEGAAEVIETFRIRTKSECPSRENIHRCEEAFLTPVGYTAFTIIHSNDTGEKTVFMMPDLAMCPTCLAEMLDPNNRRYRYPFINCTECGPRFSIIHALPYDRPNTSMKDFVMCPACQAEYENPLDRRFHAQPNACPVCGPQVALWDAYGRVLAERSDALELVADVIREGHIVAFKGIGGFQLLVDARNTNAVRELQKRKRRTKPFALMYPTLTMARAHCVISAQEENELTSQRAPIVILARKREEDVVTDSRKMLPCEAVAPGNPNLGIMLPYSPLHHVLMHLLSFPIVATSGNISDEPIVTDEYEALDRLRGIADYFLVHNRPIVRPVDDSIVREMNGGMSLIRRARGFAPLPISLEKEARGPVLATGAHQKNAVALAAGPHVFMSQHIGDLNTRQTDRAFRQAIHDVTSVYDRKLGAIACDMHPAYASTQWAEEEVEHTGIPLVRVQHHHAHVLACMADNKLSAPLLGVAFDGTGHGTDGTSWGGEFFRVTKKSIDRVAHLRTFPLLGGDAASREPWRCALGLLWEIYGAECFSLPFPPLQRLSATQKKNLAIQLTRSINTPQTSSAGRLFDAIASLVGIRHKTEYEGQAAMELEGACESSYMPIVYPYDLREDGSMTVIDWEPMIKTVVEEVLRHVPQGQVAANFHATLAGIIISVALRVGENTVALSGGCFQNKRLIEMAIARLMDAGFTPCIHRRVPPNDGSIALGQAAAVIKGYY